MKNAGVSVGEETTNPLFHGQTLLCTRLLLLVVTNAVQGIYRHWHYTNIHTFECPQGYQSCTIKNDTRNFHLHFSSSITFVQPKQPSTLSLKSETLPFLTGCRLPSLIDKGHVYVQVHTSPTSPLRVEADLHKTASQPGSTVVMENQQWALALHQYLHSKKTKTNQARRTSESGTWTGFVCHPFLLR